MALTTLDSKSALIVIDLQNGIVALPVAHSASEVVANASALANAFRHKNLPVVLVNVQGGAPGRVEQSRRLGDLPADWSDLVPQLEQQTEDHTVTKRTWGAFSNTDLKEYLEARNVTQVVIAGISTSIGVESTARFAHEYGFNVTLAIDAMTDMSAESHANSVTRIFPRLGETGTTREIISLLNSSQP